MYQPIAKEIREEILKRVKEDGVTVPKAAGDAGVAPGTVYAWLSKESEKTGTNQVELARLKRENQGLYEVIGKLTVAVEKQKRGRS